MAQLRLCQTTNVRIAASPLRSWKLKVRDQFKVRFLCNPKDVQVEMGHADIQMTYNVYGHLFNDKDSNRRRSERSERLASLLS